MSNPQPLQFGKVYHIFNRGINKDVIYKTRSNYQHFLNLYQEYIDPVADTYAYALLKNHFHFLVRIKELDEIFEKLSGAWEPVRLRGLNPSRQFSHLFNSYAKAYNKQEKRTGALFERPFKRKMVDNEFYFKNLVVYIHQNPVSHRICDDVNNYPWSSYGSKIKVCPTFLSKEIVLGWFDSVGNFKRHHRRLRYTKELRQYLIE